MKDKIIATLCFFGFIVMTQVVARDAYDIWSMILTDMFLVFFFFGMFTFWIIATDYIVEFCRKTFG